jgi:V/A-type H+-transporting ATPase subunit D
MSGRLVWGIPVSDITRRPPVRRTLGARGTAPGLTGPAAAGAAVRFEELIDLLLDAAPREMLIEKLSGALTETSRRVNTLERRLVPALERHTRQVRQALDEREREEQVRHKHLRRVTRADVGAPPPRADHR